jgi:hypothetical protein
MDNPAAFTALFTDARPVHTQGIVKFSFSVVAEDADAALKMLGGFPKPDDPTTVAIARVAGTPRVPGT